MKTEETIKDQIKRFEKRRQQAREENAMQDYRELGAMIVALEWVLEE